MAARPPNVPCLDVVTPPVFLCVGAHLGCGSLSLKFFYAFFEFLSCFSPLSIHPPGETPASFFFVWFFCDEFAFLAFFPHSF